MRQFSTIHQDLTEQPTNIEVDRLPKFPEEPLMCGSRNEIILRELILPSRPRKTQTSRSRSRLRPERIMYQPHGRKQIMTAINAYRSPAAGPIDGENVSLRRPVTSGPSPVPIRLAK